MITKSITYKKALQKVSSTIDHAGARILVTGATGLVGSSLIDVLLTANSFCGADFEIFALARNETKLKSRFVPSTKLHLIAQDILEPILIRNIDYIVHTASYADPVSYARYPTETILTNVIGTKNVLDYCKSSDYPTRVLLTSTFEVYGNSDIDEYNESNYGIIDLDLLRSCYPESKRLSELLLRSYHHEFGVNGVIARLSSIYGSMMKLDDSKAHAQFIRNALLGENIVLKSNGIQKRTYCYVLDAVIGILTVLFKGEIDNSYNVTNSNSVVSIADLAKTIANISGTDVVFSNPTSDELLGFSRPSNCILVTDKIEKLGWFPQYDLYSGLVETITILRELKC